MDLNLGDQPLEVAWIDLDRRIRSESEAPGRLLGPEVSLLDQSGTGRVADTVTDPGDPAGMEPGRIREVGRTAPAFGLTEAKGGEVESQTMSQELAAALPILNRVEFRQSPRRDGRQAPETQIDQQADPGRTLGLLNGTLDRQPSGCQRDGDGMLPEPIDGRSLA